MKPDQILASLSQLDHQKRPVTPRGDRFLLAGVPVAGRDAGVERVSARQVQLNESRISTANLTRNMAEYADNALDRADAQLSELADRVGADVAIDDPERMQRYLAERIARTPLLSDLAVYDQEGTRILSASALARPRPRSGPRPAPAPQPSWRRPAHRRPAAPSLGRRMGAAAVAPPGVGPAPVLAASPWPTCASRCSTRSTRTSRLPAAAPSWWRSPPATWC
ncbi:hypothetical protein LP419_35625 [Massilia sp. H-1]|nr:hypothetical protein LP419_35625 [Massilia sp. H-1]